MFKSKNKKIMYTPVKPNFTIKKRGVRGYYGLVFVMLSEIGQNDPLSVFKMYFLLSKELTFTLFFIG